MADFLKPIKKILFVILSLTWGGIMTAIGMLAFLALSLYNIFIFAFRGKHLRMQYKYNVLFIRIGQGWGGVNLGCVSVVCEDADDELMRHEAGHGIQNIIYGVLFPFIVAIPSFIRYWYREYKVIVKKVDYWSLPDYDSIWFEGQATRLGDKIYKEKQ